MTVHRIRDESSQDAFEIEGVRCVRETADAIYCVGESGRERWIPKSCVHDDSLTVKLWWAEKNGFV